MVIRTRVDQVRATGRATMGVSLMDLADGDSVVGVARSADLREDDETASAVPDGVAPDGEVSQGQVPPEAVGEAAPEVAGKDS